MSSQAKHSQPYQALARQWRPQNFTEVVGQEHVLKAIANGINHGRLHHAYLLTGTRGVGKTTIARIIAKCLNCLQGVTDKPCETCANCQAINQQHFIDLIEIDAASKTKVEDTRELLENVAFAPTTGRYKVYLIDEVHMLSGHSFNALLKTLEEPPEHVKFILATTDPQKLPITILSRCLQFHLKNLSPEQIQQQLSHILKQENITFETKALADIATNAKGSMRDALSLLDQAIAYGGKQITEQDVANLLGTIDFEKIIQLLNALSQQDAEALIKITDTLSHAGVDFSKALNELAATLHEIALIQANAIKNPKLTLAELAKHNSPEAIQLFYQIAILGARDLTLAPSYKIGFEMTLLRMHAFIPNVNEELSSDITTTSTQIEPKKKFEKPEALAPSTQSWPAILEQLPLTGLALNLASHCALNKIDEKEIVLSLDEKQAILLNKQLSQRIEQALIEYFGRALTLTIAIVEDNQEAPARQQQKQNDLQKQKAHDTVATDQKIQQLISAFDAQIITQSITPTYSTEEDN